MASTPKMHRPIRNTSVSDRAHSQARSPPQLSHAETAARAWGEALVDGDMEAMMRGYASGAVVRFAGNCEG
ncbi:hypothetical protein HDU93_008882, partial [Gonapodya sp. JEL0774]